MASPNQPVKRQNYNNSKKTSSRTPPTASAQPNSRDKIEKPQWSDMVKKSVRLTSIHAQETTWKVRTVKN